MATSLKAEDLGATYDFFGGYRDLRRGTVRVLHNLSFVEDPTRLLRAVRYEARLGFRMDAHTLSLARGCIDMRLVGRPVLGAPARRAAGTSGRAAAWPRRSSGWRRSASTARCIRTSTPARARSQLVESAARVMAAAPFSEARADARAPGLHVHGDAAARALRVARAPEAAPRATRTWWRPP